MTGLAATARQPNRHPSSKCTFAICSEDPQLKKKGRPKFERPKSREETPKEGTSARTKSLLVPNGVRNPILASKYLIKNKSQVGGFVVVHGYENRAVFGQKFLQ